MSISHNLGHKLFSHLYVEEQVLEHPQSLKIIEKFSSSKVIVIKHYKDVFNRVNQDFDAQSESKNLILAKKERGFLHKGSYFSDSFDHENFYYSSSLLGCLYDCEYCYLQGLYQSANSVLFVNIEDFFKEVEPLLDKKTLIAISYDTDTLALESLLNLSSKWIDFAKDKPNLNLEIRTKSANFKALKGVEVNKNVVLAWSVSPQNIIDLYENKTPSLKQRLKAIKDAIDKGWRVRVSIDPIIITQNYKNLYIELVKELFESVDASKLYSMTIGSFRMSKDHLKTLKKLQRSDLAFYDYALEDNVAFYKNEKEILDFMLKELKKFIDIKKVRVWQQQ